MAWWKKYVSIYVYVYIYVYIFIFMIGVKIHYSLNNAMS